MTRETELTCRMRMRNVGFNNMRSLHPTRMQSYAATPCGSSELSAGTVAPTRSPHSASLM